ncbi:MAG: SdrD B-like domain-containing protein [Actinomycetota bacterium]
MTARSLRRHGWWLLAIGLIAPVVGSSAARPAQAFTDAELIDASISGIVFIDYDRDGRVDVGETDSELVRGRQVTVSSENREERARSDGEAEFSLSLPNLVAFDGVEAGLRIEVEPPAGHRPTNGLASIRHVRARDGDEIVVLFGFVPESRCPDDPVTLGDPSGRFPDGHPNSSSGKLWSACFVDGSSDSDIGAQDVLVATNFDNGEWAPPDESGFGGHLDVEHLATKQQMGAIWGLAYDEWDGVLFASAVIKRHADLGPEGVDGLYWRSSDAALSEIRSVGLDELSPPDAPSFGADPPDCPRLGDGSAYDYESWTFDQTALGERWDCRDLSLAGGGSESYDWWAFDRVGRAGIGDIDVTPAGDRLVVVNAQADSVFVYDITSIGPTVTGEAAPVYVTHHEVLVPECVRGATEAWGLDAIDAGSVYVGVTCTAEVSDSASDLISHVVRLDLVTGASDVVVTLSHDHPHGPGYVDDSLPDAGRFRPWTTLDTAGRPALPTLEDASMIRWLDFLEAYGWSNTFDQPQPLLSDIEIDPSDGSLALAIMDRFPMMTGVFNCDLDPSTGGCGYEFSAPPAGDYDGVEGDDPVSGYTSGIVAYVAGDLIRACNVRDDPEDPSFVIEGDRRCDPSAHSPAFDERVGGGPAGAYEWYWNDQAFTGPGVDNPHPEGSQGALYQPPRRDDIVYTALTPAETFGAGLSRDSHRDGSHVAAIQFFRTDFTASDGRGWKSAALGDVEGCVVPMEIGDHVWFDDRPDGRRDPDEPPLPGVSVALIEAASGITIATTLSDIAGRWSFTTADGLEPFTDYVLRFRVGSNVRIDDSRSFELVPTFFRVDGVRRDLDSDLVMPESNGLPLEMPVRTGAAGESDHSLDAGFARIGDVQGLTPDDLANGRAGPPWGILGILFGGFMLFAIIFVFVLRKFVW